jgi:hypothetical protein
MIGDQDGSREEGGLSLVLVSSEIQTNSLEKWKR